MLDKEISTILSQFDAGEAAPEEDLNPDESQTEEEPKEPKEDDETEEMEDEFE